MRILLTGKNGQLGRCFQDKTVNSEHEVFAYGSNTLDISNSAEVANTVMQVKPDVIVNAAAYTGVDKAEEESVLAFSVNELGVKNLAEQAALLNIPLIHVSTDYVFDGRAVEPYSPMSSTNPQSVYGASKLAGEKAVQLLCDKYAILRTAWVFSEYGNNFVRTMVRLAKERDEISVVADQYGCPTYAGDLAQAILTICEQYELGVNVESGIYHYCGNAQTSWHGFARAIFYKAVECSLIETAPKLHAISTEQYPTPAKRPEYSVMSIEALSKINASPSNWSMALTNVLKRI